MAEGWETDRTSERTSRGNLSRFVGSTGAGDPIVGGCSATPALLEGRTERISEMMNMCRDGG